MEDKDKARLEDEPDKDKAGGDDTPEDMGLKPTGVCATCGMGNPMENKFCGQCGATMAAPELEDEEGAPSSENKPGAVVAAKRVSVEASVAAILGAPSDSVPALKGRAIDLRQVFDTAAGVFATTVPGEIIGALLVVPEQLHAGKKAVAAQKRDRVTAEAQERMSLAKRLNALALDGRPRSSIFEDRIDAKTQERTIVLRPEYARMDLDVFRGLVTTLERGRAKSPARNPFQPDAARAQAASASTDPRRAPAADAPTATVIAWASQQPSFSRMKSQIGARFSDEQIARQLADTMRAQGGA